MVRGPYERLKYDFRRLWECPECGHRTHGGGEQTTQTCDCGRKATPPRTIFMRLLAEGGRCTDIRPPGAPPPSQLSAPRKGEVLARSQSSPTMPATTPVEEPSAAVSDAPSASAPSPPPSEPPPSESTLTESTAVERVVTETSDGETAPQPSEASQSVDDSSSKPSPDASSPAGESAEPNQKQKGRRRGRRSKSKRRRKGGQ